MECVPNVQYGLWVIQWCEEKIAVKVFLDALVHIIQPKTGQNCVELGRVAEYPRPQ